MTDPSPTRCRSWLRPAAAAGAAALLLPLAALAHTGADGGAHHGFAAGFLHPFTGLDHLAAMLAVGYWSATAAPRRPWAAPLAFAAMVLAGALLAAAGSAIPAVEPMIAASLLVIGLLVAMQARLPLPAMAALVGAFAIFHGAAHGMELGGTAALAGMVLATLLLHAAGLALGRATRRRAVWPSRAGGLAVALFGAVMLVPLFGV